MAWLGGQYAVTATATSITSALALAESTYARQIDVKYSANATAGSRVFLGDSDVTNVPANAHIELTPDTGWSAVAIGNHAIRTGDVFIVGTVAAANIVFVTVIT